MRILPVHILLYFSDRDPEHKLGETLQSLARKLAISAGQVRDEMIENDIARSVFGAFAHMCISSDDGRAPDTIGWFTT